MVVAGPPVQDVSICLSTYIRKYTEETRQHDFPGGVSKYCCSVDEDMKYKHTISYMRHCMVDLKFYGSTSLK